MPYHKEEFYKVNSQKYKKYAFQGKGRLVEGEKPDFFEFLRKYSDKGLRALDLGCGSGELTLKLASCFREIIGIDPVEGYLETAEKQKCEAGIENVEFQVADGRKLPFADECFDMVYSSRGPLSAGMEFMQEGFRVLKPGGFMIEETIGEDDKLELKEIFGRGQNYPVEEKKLEAVEELLRQTGMKLIESRYFLYYEVYPSLNEVVEVLEHAPIIPDFDRIRDRNRLEAVDEKLNHNGIRLSSHRMHWVARK